jgi:hypothetical protein
MHSHHIKATWAVTGCLALLLTQGAQAAGFYISEVGTPGSLGTAGVANPVNTYSADASWTNPAVRMVATPAISRLFPRSLWSRSCLTGFGWVSRWSRRKVVP